jgi:restriction endonuclease
MKLKFKKQLFQTNAVNAVADCFAGQPKTEGITYRIDTGKIGRIQSAIDFSQSGFNLHFCVNQSGDRLDSDSGGNVHDINLLTVVASESYKVISNKGHPSSLC